MILELEKGAIKIKQNSCESIDEALIYLEFKDRIISTADTIKLFINEKEAKEIRMNLWKFDLTLLTSKECKIEVVVIHQMKASVYTLVTPLEKYISFGKLEVNRVPQFILDINQKLEKLETRIKKIEIEKSIV